MPDSLSVAEATALVGALRSGLAPPELGAPETEPVVVVDLDGAASGRDLHPPAGWPGVLIGTSTSASPPVPPPGLDVLITTAVAPPAPWIGTEAGPGEAIRELDMAARRNPQAATTLVQVLRTGRTLGTDAALAVESLAYSTLQAGREHRRWLETRPRPGPDTRTDPTVRLDRIADTLHITLDRPRRRNAYSARMRDDLVAALEVAVADTTIASVHLDGLGPDFCSGGDLAEFGSLPDPATAHGIRMQRSAAWLISQLSERVTFHLHGGCVGAGIELAAFARTIEATEDAAVWLPEVGMGLIPGAGGTVSLPRRIGRPRTAWLALTGRRLDAPTAYRWGLVDGLGPEFDGGGSGRPQ